MTDSSPAKPVSAVHHVDALPAGTHLAEFEIVALLGVGGFGMVYQAFDHSLHRAVAIKEYMSAALAGRTEGLSLWVRTPADAPAFEAGLSSFVGEARMLAQFDIFFCKTQGRPCCWTWALPAMPSTTATASTPLS